MSTTFATISVSVLNASYEDLGNTKLDRAIALVYLKKEAEIVEADENRTVRTATGEVLPFPKVIRLLKYRNVPFYYSEEYFSKSGVLRRDNHTCGYCGKTSGHGLTMTHDHILPKSKGGKDTWMNAITACTKCNSKKADRTPEEANMPLLFKPTIPMRVYYKSESKRPKRAKR